MAASLLSKIFSPVHFESTSKVYGTIYSCILAVLYVGSLYVNKSPFPRDHPETVRKRFKGVFLTSLVAPSLVFQWSSFPDGLSKHSSHSLFRWLGLHTSNIVTASLLPIILTMILFLGPIVQSFLDKDDDDNMGHGNQYYQRPSLSTQISRCLNDIVWWRNFVVAPFTEEFVYRACMLPFLVPAFGLKASVFLCPLFFGIAHFHHAIEGIRMGLSLQAVIVRSVFQMTYTTIFGAYSAFLFLRTGHLIGPVVCHSFCNFMGFPEFDRIFGSQNSKVIAVSYIVGLVGFCILLFPLTDPVYFSSIYWHSKWT